MTSIKAKIGRRMRGADEIQNTLKNPKPFLTKPRMVTAKKTAIAMTAVTAIWLVVVKAIGRRPRKFATTMNMNNVII